MNNLISRTFLKTSSIVSRRSMSSMVGSHAPKTTLLLNWYANPYHTPIFVAKEKGWFEEENIDLAILETTNPSDVTEIVGSGQVDLGLKAMIHILAAKDRDLHLKSFGTLLDEPPTGLIYKKSSGISKFEDIIGKRVGYIGHFGKIMIEDLAKQANIPLDSFECVRVGMNVTDAVLRGDVDTGIGFTNFQKIELAHLANEEVGMLRIDELDGLGCCCFCSVMYVANENVVNKNPELIKSFMKAIRRGTDYTIENPDEAWETMCIANPRLRTPLYSEIYRYTLPYFSRDLLNVQRDWDKVTGFCKHLEILPQDFDQNTIFTNEYVPSTGTPSVQPITPGGVLGNATA